MNKQIEQIKNGPVETDETIEKLMAMRVNINTSYKLGTSWFRVCIHKKTSLSLGEGKAC